MQSVVTAGDGVRLSDPKITWHSVNPTNQTEKELKTTSGTTSNFTLPMFNYKVEDSGTKIYCTLKDSGSGTPDEVLAKSEEAILTVVKKDMSGLFSPTESGGASSDFTLDLNQNKDLILLQKVINSGADYTYSWYKVNKSGDDTLVLSGKGGYPYNSLSIKRPETTKDNNGDQYYCVLNHPEYVEFKNKVVTIKVIDSSE